MRAVRKNDIGSETDPYDVVLIPSAQPARLDVADIQSRTQPHIEIRPVMCVPFKRVAQIDA
ncbi:hypothetical protein D3C71_1905890 [compost metagenome]